uniref:Small G protein signaling modulator 1-like n=1 Tax=Sinocyclocheilus rhinocerous TaxID=307959 RepID=A0A673GX27_9TELE
MVLLWHPSVVSPCVTQVKQIMEEAVTRKFVHEDSSHIVSFCAAVEACVLHGLKRRAAGFLRSNKIAALFTKVGKSFPPAEELCRKAQELELVFESKRSQSLSYSESTRKMPKVPKFSPQAVRHLWIHTALIEKVLDKIVLYLVENSSKFYEKEAILMDPVDGPILASLLVGPCALEYTKMKTADHFWTDPSADELVQRHRIHSGHCRQDSPTKRPALCIQKRHSSSSMDERPSPSPSARDYVESLHQNSRATLLFGKNNVLVQPRDDMEAIPGYLSLHQTADCMTLKWTPNQLMNALFKKEITLILDCGGTVVLVSQDGIQRPPLRFPRGGHLLQFLSCLENGLLPHDNLVFFSFFLKSFYNYFIHYTQYSTRSVYLFWSQCILALLQTYEEKELLRLVYFGGVEPSLRKEVWPFLLGHYQFGMSEAERKEVDEQMRACYEQTMSEWLGCEAIVRQREKEQHAVALAKCSSGASIDSTTQRIMHHDSTISNEVFESVEEVDQIESEPKSEDIKHVSKISNGTLQNGTSSPDSGHPSSRNFSVTSGQSDSLSTEDSGIHDPSLKAQLQLAVSKERFASSSGEEGKATEEGETKSVEKLGVREYSKIELLDMYSLNLHRIDKDVQRCDRNYWYFTPANLEKLRNIMCSYIWQHLEIGYVQGMCDLLAPLLVILDDEAMAFSCFTELMTRMNQNFPHGGAMDTHFANMRSLIQILDAELFELMHQNGDYTHFYFCYRWFLLDFKRELVYDDVFAVWEVIWAAKCVSSSHFVLFIALALVEIYRDIILENNMDFTDIIKFFNEMAEHHNIKQILTLARDLVCKVQTLIENK